MLSDDEFGRLSGSFNDMLSDLRGRADELRASRARIVAASDAERRRVERNIHDGAQQRLVALALELQMLEESARSSGSEELATAAEESRATLKAALDELRELARGLHPSVLATDGLPPALEQLASRAPLPVTIEASEERYPEQVESTAYFVASEALANVAKYAEASKAEISLERRNGRLVIQLADDGKGGAETGKGSGLTGLSDRVAALDGSLTVESPVGEGTRVRAELPLGKEATGES